MTMNNNNCQIVYGKGRLIQRSECLLYDTMKDADSEEVMHMKVNVGLVVMNTIQERIDFNALSTLNSSLRKVIYLHISYI
jgi:hypothetical protein